MKCKRELVLYESEIEKYLEDRPVEVDEKRKIRNALAEFMIILKERGKTWPAISDYEEYCTSSKEIDKSKGFQTTGQNKSRIKKFFDWLGKEQTTMTDETKELDLVFETQGNGEYETPKEKEATQPETVKNKAKGGRKVMDRVNGQKRSEKLMIYLTPELIADLRDWCNLKGISYANFVVELIENFMNERRDKLNSFRELRDNI